MRASSPVQKSLHVSTGHLASHFERVTSTVYDLEPRLQSGISVMILLGAGQGVTDRRAGGADTVQLRGDAPDAVEMRL